MWTARYWAQAALSGFVFGNTTDGHVVQVSLPTNSSGGHDTVVMAKEAPAETS